MRFVFQGAYTHFRGYVFAHGKSVDVKDRATIAALEKMPNFRKVEDEPQKVQAPAAPRVLSRSTISVPRRK